jgi:magnesium transporter
VRELLEVQIYQINRAYQINQKMVNPMSRRSRKKGLAPGTPVHIGQKKTDKSSVRLIDFNETDIDVNIDVTDFAIVPPPPKQMIHWAHLTGVHDVELVQNLCKQ